MNAIEQRRAAIRAGQAISHARARARMLDRLGRNPIMEGNTMTSHTTNDFANARFATYRSPGERVLHAVQLINGSAMPWMTSGGNFRSHADLAGAGWTPVVECPNPEMHDRWHEAADQRDATRYTTTLAVNYETMWWRALRQLVEARAMAALWKEATRRAVRDSREYADTTRSALVNMRNAHDQLDATRLGRDRLRDYLTKVEARNATQADNAREAQQTIETMDDTIRALRAAQPLPVEVTDEMVGRAVGRHDSAKAVWDPSRAMREALTAALTPEPQRPEGAEKWEDLLATFNYLHDETGASRVDLATLANDLAVYERGGRVAGGDS